MLEAAGRVVQDYSRVDPSAGRGVAVREFVTAPPTDASTTPCSSTAGRPA